MADFYPGKHTEWKIKLGDAFEAKIDKQLVCKGYIEDINIQYGGNKNHVLIAGRDKTGDLVDCGRDSLPNEWKNETAFNIAKDLCSPFGISVSGAASVAIDSFKYEEGEPVYIAIHRLCRHAGVMAIGKGDGDLNLVVAGTENASDGIELGVNATGASIDFSDRDRFSSYVVKGLGVGNDNKATADYISPSSSVTDSVIRRSRPSIILSDVATDSGKCQNSAKYERQFKAGLSRKRTYRVLNWVQKNGKVWTINTRVRVKDSRAGIDKNMLISDVNFCWNSDEGKITYIGVVDMATFGANDTVIKAEFDA
jgi:prophage tail gpP-like protein